jgi:hypothetical protein
MSDLHADTMADEWFPDDQHGYSIALCACKDGPYLGDRQMGTPCVCERCRRLTREQWDFLVRALLDAHAPATCSTCGDSGRVDWAPGQIRDDEGEQQLCPDCNPTSSAGEGQAARDAAWAEFRDGPNYTPTDRYPVRDAFDAGWTLAHQMGRDWLLAVRQPVGVERAEYLWKSDDGKAFASERHVREHGAQVGGKPVRCYRRTVTTFEPIVSEWEVVGDE